MRVNTSPRRKNSPRPAWKVQTAYHQWLRGRPCACGGKNPNCGGKICAAHGPDKVTKGMGTKVDDRHAMPLSWNCHNDQHSMGWPTFAKKYLPGDGLEVCEAYWKSWKGDKGVLA